MRKSGPKTKLPLPMIAPDLEELEVISADSSLRIDLIDVFYEQCYPYMPFLPKSLFIARIHHMSPFLLNAMYSFGAFYSNKTAPNYTNPIVFYEKARNLFNSYLEHASVFTIYGLIVLGLSSACICFYCINH
jgi:hypothetical protein